MQASMVRTCPAPEERLAPQPPQEFAAEPAFGDTIRRENDTEGELINLHPEAEQDVFLGFGGAFTESAATAWQRLSPAKQDALIRAYFSPTDGIGYTCGRVHINSCDFSLSPYCYVAEGDLSLASFDMSREDAAVVPMLRAAAAYTGQLRLLASPWSPPPFMKTNRCWQGGYLKPECYPHWANYLRRYVLEMEKRGLPLWGITVQNETRHHQPWESCIYTAGQELAFVRDFLGPALEGTGVRIFAYDHCKERLFERALHHYSDPAAEPYFAGLACHWYSGDHFGEIELCRRSYPHKAVIMSEGCTYSPGAGFHEEIAWHQAETYAHDIIGDLNAGLSAFFDWNLTLDEQNGPYHWREGRNGCDAAVFCDTARDALHYHPNYCVIGQFSKFIRPGAVRIGISTYTSALEATAFRNTDRSIAAVVYNPSDSQRPYTLRIHQKLLKRELPPHSIETVCFTEQP